MPWEDYNLQLLEIFDKPAPPAGHAAIDACMYCKLTTCL